MKPAGGRASAATPSRARAADILSAPVAALHITDIESAINWWRARSPSTDGVTACAEVRALAEAYGVMAWERRTQCDEQDLAGPARRAWLAWYATTPDSPCIAICSTSQGDDECKGCGRSFEEVRQWTSYSAADKRAVWHRIVQDGSAWRFNRYAERAPELRAAAAPAAGGAVHGPAGDDDVGTAAARSRR